MAVQVHTNDSSALTDADLDELASMEGSFGIGEVSKAKETWVLITTARIDGKLHGFTFATLERIGGTPSCLWGLASFRRNSKRDTVLRAVIGDQYRRAVLAFPDEDVLVGTRMIDPSAFVAFKGLEDICPRPGHKLTGEERAWSRRLAKRFNAEGRIDDRSFVITGSGSPIGVFDFEAAKPGSVSDDVAAFFAALDRERGDVLVAFGWAMAEELAAKHGPR